MAMIRKLIVILSLLCACRCYSQQGDSTLEMRFNNLIQTGNIVIGEKHFQEENIIVYNQAAKLVNDSVHLLLEWPFFFNILVSNWIHENDSLLFDYIYEYREHTDYNELINLIDSIIHLQNNKSILAKIHFVDLNAPDLGDNGHWLKRIIMGYKDRIGFQHEFYVEKKWKKKDIEALKEIYAKSNIKDSVFLKFMASLIYELDNRNRIPNSLFSGNRKFCFREKLLARNLHYFLLQLNPADKFVLLTGIAHISRDSLTVMGNWCPPRYTWGLSNTTYINLVYLNGREPYSIHKDFDWEKSLLLQQKSRSKFPLFIDVRKYTTSYDYMLVL